MKRNKIQLLLSRSLILRASLIWLGLCALAFVNGAFREIVLRPLFHLSELQAHQISCFTGVLLWTLLTVWYWKVLNIRSLAQASLVGLGWLVMTFLFETFILNRNLTWTQIGGTYSLSHGQLWGLVLAWIGLMPIVLFSFLSLRPSSKISRF